MWGGRGRGWRPRESWGGVFPGGQSRAAPTPAATLSTLVIQSGNPCNGSISRLAAGPASLTKNLFYRDQNHYIHLSARL